jgi:hypothetical protein
MRTKKTANSVTLAGGQNLSQGYLLQGIKIRINNLKSK